MPSKILITSTGRAGTSFLVQLFTALGLDTGYRDLDECRHKLNPTAHAGLEWHPEHGVPPRIFKSTHWASMKDTEARDAISLEHVYLCVRDLTESANSRRRCNAASTGKAPRGVPGGLVGTSKPEEQEAVLLERQWRLMLLLAQAYCPVTVIAFPDMVRDICYLYAKLREGLPLGDDLGAFRGAWEKTVQPQWIHQEVKQNE